MKSVRKLLWVFIISTSACGNPMEQELEPHLTTLRHPLVGQTWPAGEVPLADTKDSKNGKRYAFIDSARQQAEEEATVYTSEVVELESSPITAEHRMFIESQQGTAQPTIIHEVLSAELARRAIAVGDSVVRVNLATPPQNAWVEVLRQIGLGEINSEDDRLRVHAQELAKHQTAEVEIADQFYRELRSDFPEITIVSGCDGGCLYLNVPNRLLVSLSQRAGVERIDSEALNNVNSSPTALEVLNGTQVALFTDPASGYGVRDGENGADTDIHVAVIDETSFHDGHVGFREATTSITRIRTEHICSTSSCTGTSDFTSTTGNHGTTMAGIVFGDLRDGQDPSITTAVGRQQRSAFAGEAWGHLYDITLSSVSTEKALQHIQSVSSYKPSLVHLATNAADLDPSCLGKDSLSREANDTYEAGVLPIIAAGNIPGTSSNCTVESPGSAIGSFTVGATGNFDADNGSEADVRNADIWADGPDGSAYGGNFVESDGRSIVDLVPYGVLRLGYDNAGGYSRDTSGTSNSSAFAASAAVAFIDQYINSAGFSDIRWNPGTIAANLLLWGDRKQQNPSPLVTRFSDLYGAGRMKARRYDHSGMDSPWYYRNGWTCINHNESYKVSIGAISSDVETFKGVIWWYDRRHEVGTPIDNIDLELRDSTSGLVLRGSYDTSDNKERVYYDGIGGRTAEIRIVGTNVTSDGEGCGTDSMKVYFAFFIEDSDRDDADGPSAADVEAE